MVAYFSLLKCWFHIYFPVLKFNTVIFPTNTYYFYIKSNILSQEKKLNIFIIEMFAQFNEKTKVVKFVICLKTMAILNNILLFNQKYLHQLNCLTSLLYSHRYVPLELSLYMGTIVR